MTSWCRTTADVDSFQVNNRLQFHQDHDPRRVVNSREAPESRAASTLSTLKPPPSPLPKVGLRFVVAGFGADACPQEKPDRSEIKAVDSVSTRISVCTVWFQFRSCFACVDLSCQNLEAGSSESVGGWKLESTCPW